MNAEQQEARRRPPAIPMVTEKLVVQAGRALAAALAMVFACALAHGQGFMAKPMSFDVTVTPGVAISGELELRNTANEPQTLNVQALYLSQSVTGGWVALDPKDEKTDVTGLRSCAEWVRLDPSKLELQPNEVKKVRLLVRTPTGVRGFYSAAIVVENEPVKRGSFKMVVRFLLPMRINIQGAPAREDIHITDADMRFLDEKDRTPRPSDIKIPTTAVIIKAKNAGETYGKLSGKVTVLRDAGGRWRRLSEVELPERGIVPGVEIAPVVDLERRLPSGKYKVSAALSVNGRRLRTVERELDFTGDPTVTSAAGYVQMALPEFLEVEAYPGAMRSVSATVQNLSDEPGNVSCRLLRPKALSGVTMGDVSGEMFNAAEWLEVRPEQFTLRPSADRNLRLTVRVPEDRPIPANAYAELHLRATHEDGGAAGDATALVWVRNVRAETVIAGVSENLEIAHQDGSRYSVSAEYVNIGNVHFKAGCSVSVVNAAGTAALSVPLETTVPLALPMGKLVFSGTLDFADVEPGEYELISALDLGPNSPNDKLRIRVEDGPQGKRVSVLSVQLQAPAPTQDPVGAEDERK
ncbi:MAG: hypothetical protein HPY44_17485 [Armatimonadetes bacterium]|nr:hypothetical protein [Armatimonadota bacterium]